MPGFRRDNSGHEATAKSASVPNSLPQDQRVDPNLVSPRILRLAGKWSGRWESNPRLKLGKLGYYHYTTPAPLFDSSRVAELVANGDSYGRAGAPSRSRCSPSLVPRNAVQPTTSRCGR